MESSKRHHHVTHRRPSTAGRHSTFPQPRSYALPSSSSSASAKAAKAATEQSASSSVELSQRTPLTISTVSTLPAFVSAPLYNKRRLLPRVRITIAVALRSAAFILILTLFITMSNPQPPLPSPSPSANHYGNVTSSTISSTMDGRGYITTANDSGRPKSGERRGDSEAVSANEIDLQRTDVKQAGVTGAGDRRLSDDVYYRNNNTNTNLGHTVKRNLNDADGVTVDKMIPLTADELVVRLGFSNKTALNFMHFHKTGGVAVKTALYQAFAYSRKRDGTHVKARDACYQRAGLVNATNLPTFVQWRCDWEPLRAMNETSRSEYDVVFGHQFVTDGVTTLLTGRDVRTFTIVRHPLARRVSFYFHFFVREIGRRARDVSLEELRAFALRDAVPPGADVGRDVGPNYVAGRLLSDGRTGFVGSRQHQWYDVRHQDREQVIRNASAILDSYLFVSLHSQPAATRCLLRRAASALDVALGISPPAAPALDSLLGNVHNAGRYHLTAGVVWNSMTATQRAAFEQHEWVDLHIFKHAQRLFHQQAHFFSCDHHLIPETF